MSNFFDKNFLQSVASGLLILIFSIWLSNRKQSTSYAGKNWKLAVITGNLMIFGGLYALAVNAPNGGFNNLYVDMGFSAFFFGFPVKYFGKFMVWWHRS
jgi:hypothetical protein